jgi:UMF1 family MFS transporter
MIKKLKIDREAWAWAFYDWANSAFATTVMAGFFPVFFKQFWSAGVEASVSTFRLGAANSIASIVVAVMAPILGAIADGGGARKKFLCVFALLGAVSTGALYFVAQGQWMAAATLFLFASVGFAGGNVFYDSLLIGVAGRDHQNRVDFVSALGFGLGYLGGGLLFAVNVAMTLNPHWFGLADAGEAVRWSFISVALWWLIFSVPLFRYVKERKSGRERPGAAAVGEGIRELAQTFREIRGYRPVLLFLVAYWLYIDGVDTVIRMAVDYGMSLGFETSSLMTALLITQFVGFPAAIAFGKLGERMGAKRGIYLGVAAYVGIVLWGYYMDSAAEFYGLAVSVGLVQGGIQALSRSFYARLIPADRSAQFFGFYNMLGKFAAVIGPVMMGWVAVVTGSPRAAILSILILFALGAFVLLFVESPAQHGEAEGTEA